MRNNFTFYAPPLLSYAEAVKLEASIKPIRGREANEKPLAPDRSHNYVQIRSTKDGIVVGVRHWGAPRPLTPLVIYHEDETITVNAATWRGGQDIISMLLHTQIKEQFYDRWVHAHWTGGYGWLKARDNTTFIIKDGRLWSPEPVFSRVWRLSRKKFNPIRAKYQPFVDYFLGYVSLREGQQGMVSQYTSGISELMLSNNPEQMQRAADAIVGYRTFDPVWAKRRIQTLLIEMHKHEVLELKTIEGKIIKDQYKDFFSKAS